nr:unnamed protein product [Rangifer tarandus platyrhynchus]
MVCVSRLFIPPPPRPPSAICKLILTVGARGGGPACTMNPWLLVCLVGCFVVAWAPTVHSQGAFEDCCLAYHRRTRLSVLRHAQSYHRQDVSGSCNLPAVIFFLPQKNKMVCGRPGARWVLAGMKILDARKKSQLKHPEKHHGTQRNFRGGDDNQVSDSCLHAKERQGRNLGQKLMLPKAAALLVPSS